MCKHELVRLTIYWTVKMDCTGSNVIVSVVDPTSLKVVANCPECDLRGSVYTTMGNWHQRWPRWLVNRVRQLAYYNSSLRQAVAGCMPGYAYY